MSLRYPFMSGEALLQLMALSGKPSTHVRSMILVSPSDIFSLHGSLQSILCVRLSGGGLTHESIWRA